ncbi:unnamed protein product [Phytomonas sp. Hart1]|nr:unnamed protein product [Phytomonas sp. Hart1]|eukprot:CCW69441.1 unnamed protein product [Phytomonas sp. isolate Hart1]
MHHFMDDEGGTDTKASFRRIRLQTEPEATTKTITTNNDDTEIEPPPQLPIGHKNYFCCRTCRRILSESQWYAEGCSECGTGPIRRGELLEYASSHFHNFFGLIAPEKSWVARLIRKKNCANGVFAEAISDEELEADKEDAEMENEASEDEPERDFLPSTDVHAGDKSSLTNSELWQS